MKSDYSRTVRLLCPTCANSEFSSDDTIEKSERIYTCSDCGNAFGYDDIMAANGDIIQNTVTETKAEIIKDFRKDLKNMFKKYK